MKNIHVLKYIDKQNFINLYQNLCIPEKKYSEMHVFHSSEKHTKVLKTIEKYMKKYTKKLKYFIT